MNFFADYQRKLSIFLFRTGVQKRRELWLKIATMLDNDVPIVDAISELHRRRKMLSGTKAAETVALGNWLVAMRNGQPLSQAIGEWVSPEEVMMITAGDSSGQLSKALISMATVMAAKSEIKSCVLSGISYPCVLLLAAFGVLYLFGIKVIPEISNIGIVRQWTGYAAFLIALSEFVQQWFWIIFTTTILAVVAFFVSLPIFDGRLRIVLDRYVPYSVYRVMIGSSWLIALAALTRSGVRIEESLEKLARPASPWLKTRLVACLAGIRSGLDIGDALLKTNYQFPDMEIINDLGTYSRYRNFDIALERLGNEWIKKSTEAIRTRMRVIFFICLVIVGLLTLLMATGILDMQQQISVAAQGISH